MYAGTDIYGVSFKPSQTSSAIVIGLDRTDNAERFTDQAYDWHLSQNRTLAGVHRFNDVDFGWHFKADGTVQVVESGAVRMQSRGAARMQSAPYAANDLFEVRVNVDGQIEYVHDKVVAYTSQAACVFPLSVATSFYEAGELREVHWMYVSQRGSVQWINNGDVTEADGSTTKQVKTAVGAITKVGTSTGWNAGARSMLSFGSASEIGGMSFVPTRNDKAMMMGISHEDSDKTDSDIDYAWRLTNAGKISVYENGLEMNSGLAWQYSAGDLLEVRVGLYGEVEYAVNRVVKYTSKKLATFPLLVDASLHDTDASATQVRFTYKADTDRVVWSSLSSGLSVPTSAYGNYGSIRMVSGGSSDDDRARSLAIRHLWRGLHSYSRQWPVHAGSIARWIRRPPQQHRLQHPV
jgi:hypothetical protein